MQLTTSLTRGDILAIVEHVAAETYAGNIVADVEHLATRTRGAHAGRHVYRVKLNARDSRAVGARRSWSGRRGPWTCWHAYRDVFAAWLLADGHALIRTGVETYRGAAQFLDTFPATGAHELGSAAAPVAMADACDCETVGGRDDVRDARDYVAELEAAHNLIGHAAFAAAYGPAGIYGQVGY